MADAFLKVLLDSLSSLMKDQIGLILGVHEEMSKLASVFATIQAVLEDAELNHLESKAIQIWLIKLTDAAYDVEDILDECATHASKTKHLPSYHRLKGIPFRFRIGRRMKQATAKLEEIAAERTKFHLRPTDFERPSRVDVIARETGSLLNETELIIGRDAEKEEIVQILVNQVKNNPGISVLPIIGLGGLGKTTLAQLVFNDPSVNEHFDKKMWVCVSDNFDVKTLIKDINHSSEGSPSVGEGLPLDTLQRHLWELLIGKRYLLVLDDVWNDDQQKWSDLKNVLLCGAAGSSVLVTTRLQKVGEIMGNFQTRNLKGLTEEQCWILLKQRAFRSEEMEQYPKLEVIGKQIAKKCAGVPLAAKAHGGLLRFQRSEKEWMYVKESEVWNLDEGKTKILSVLRLSYQHLPLYLRQCFAYCAIFPKDSQIGKEDLIRRWAAHGYISSNGTLEVEDVGEHIWNELIVRSFFQNFNNEDGEISTTKVVRMHDLVHDLAQSIMESEVPRTQLEIMLKCDSNSKIREVDQYRTQMDVFYILKKYKQLRVLRLIAVDGMKDLPSTIGHLLHLRWLDLSCNMDLRTLPESICNLWNLQILNLNNCIRLHRLCKKMGHFKNLRHLFLENCNNLVETPSYIRESTSLKTLSKFIVGHSKGNGLEELECLNLRGRLEIWHLERVKNLLDAKKANLSEKNHLDELKLVWRAYNFTRLGEEDMDEKVLEALQPHSNVKRFSICGLTGRHFLISMKMSTMVGKLPKYHESISIRRDATPRKPQIVIPR